MAEYNMTYNELKIFVDKCIDGAEKKANLSEHKVEILAALTVNSSSDNSTEMKDIISLWDNQIGKPSELLLGTRYIRIKDSMIAFIEVACCSGLVDALISNNPVAGITVGVISGILRSLIGFFTSVSNLDDLDFCIYMQAVCHFKAHKPFTKNDLREWFPHGENLICNMHNSKWDCEFIENDKCSMLTDTGIEQALDSLTGKGLLIRERSEKQYFFKFPY